MRVFVNGEAKEFERDSLSLKELLEELGYKEGFAVALNETFVLKSKFIPILGLKIGRIGSKDIGRHPGSKGGIGFGIGWKIRRIGRRFKEVRIHLDLGQVF